MLDRSKCKEMWVWDYRKSDKEKRIVIDIARDGRCVVIKETYNQEFLNYDLAYQTEEWNHCEEIKEPKKRLMTREEVLGFIEYNYIVVRMDQGEICTKYFYDYSCDISNYQYATITADGIIGEWKKFEVEE